MKLNVTLRKFGLTLVAASIGTLTAMSVLAADESNPSANKIPPFAVIGDQLISLQHFDAVYYESSRNKFYHGQPPELEVAKMQREVGDKLIADALLVTEAKRRGIKPDEAEVAKNLERYEQSNADDPRWLQMRDAMLPQLTKQVEEEVLAQQFEALVRNDIAEPSEEQLRQYYASHADLFTQPEQVRVSRILLTVSPGANQDTWNAARDKLLDIVKQVEEEGADFGEMAKQYSEDKDTADKMGDMGYLHGGMLAAEAQGTIDTMAVGDFSKPLVTTKGVSILKLTARNPASLNSFENVKQRAEKLWQREESEKVFEALIADLKSKTQIWTNNSRYLPLE